MSNEYQLVDGSPRYGSRTDHTQQTAQAPALRVEETAEAAARLGLDDMAAAIDCRLTSSWADKEDPLVATLRKDHPEELAAARALVKLHLGSQRQWRLKAQTVRDSRLAAVMRRRRASGSAREILVLRLGLLIALFAPPNLRRGDQPRGHPEACPDRRGLHRHGSHRGILPYSPGPRITCTRGVTPLTRPGCRPHLFPLKEQTCPIRQKPPSGHPRPWMQSC